MDEVEAIRFAYNSIHEGIAAYAAEPYGAHAERDALISVMDGFLRLNALLSQGFPLPPEWDVKATTD